VRYPGWAVAGVGSEAEQEAGSGSWIMLEVVRTFFLSLTHPFQKTTNRESAASQLEGRGLKNG
jgi:hypothetical protein